MKSIDEEVVQEFVSEHHKLRINLLFTASWLKSEIKKFLDQFELTQQQYNVIRILRRSHPKPLSTQQITSRMVDRYADTSRVVDRLCRKGLCHKEVCATDRRLVDVTISDKGLEWLAEIDKKYHDLENVINSFSEEKAAQLNDLLDELRHAGRNGEKVEAPTMKQAV